jgi:hypothetical protein
MIEPEKVASAILDAATDPADAIRVGVMSKPNTTMAEILPAPGETMAKMQLGRQQRDEAPHSREGTLLPRRRVWPHPRPRRRERRRPKEAEETNVRA